LFVIFYVCTLLSIQHCFICRLSDSTVSEDAGIEPRSVATSAFAVRRLHFIHPASSHSQSGTSHPLSATSHPQSATSHPQSATSHPQSATSHPQSATSHPLLEYISSTTRLHLIHLRKNTWPETISRYWPFKTCLIS
jgi:hypothetical protein